MKRTITALAFCCSLLLVLSLFLFPPVEAKENTLLKLLNLPAPPPPNPLSMGSGKPRDEKFYDKSKPPRDDAPIADLLDYWRQQSSNYQDLRYQAEMSPRVRERLHNEILKNPKLAPGLINALRDDPRSADLIKKLYDAEDSGLDRSDRSTLKQWLTYNSPFFSDDLARVAGQAGDVNEYVSNQEELLALTTVDFDKARPMIDRLYNDPSLKTSRVLARWALYRHALQTDSVGDIERYRDELKAIVEDKTALPGMRDLAMDALVAEKEWSGRDEWYFSLLADETLSDLGSYTGLTTLILVSPDDKYIDKMLELVESSNAAVRTAAVKNLLLKLNTAGPEVLKVFLPWLEDPKWALNNEIARLQIVQRLTDFQIPESVPGLITIMDEPKVTIVPKVSSNANAAVANAMIAAARAANAAAAAANSGYPVATSDPGTAANPKDGVQEITYPYRYSAINALAKQRDPRAVPALKRVLPKVENYERYSVIAALLLCGGFTIAEQMEALDMAAKGVREFTDDDEDASAASPDVRYYSLYSGNVISQPLGPESIKTILSQQLAQSPEISDELARAIVARIAVLDTTDPQLARAYRQLALRWQNSVINLLLLNDLKQGKADSETILRLLGQRSELREKQSTDVYSLRTGVPTAVGIAACMFEDQNEYYAILDGGDPETKTAMLSCARLLRTPLPIEKVAENLASTNELLTTAAERYLEAEDSAQARQIVLARHPNEARIMGATSAFFVDGAPPSSSELLWALYSSTGNNFLYYGWNGSGNDSELAAIDKQLQKEVLADESLLGVYAYERNYIRIYSDRVVFSWDEDNSRYRERPLARDEFEYLTGYLTANNVDELPPFLTCGGEYCSARELLMLGRAGGRRVYMNGDPGEFFLGLDKYFERLKQQGGTLKYALSREIPGLEIVLASDDLYAHTVWSGPGDLRVAASDGKARKRIEAKMEELINGETEESEEDEGPENEDEGQEPARESWASLMKKLNSVGKAWYSIVNGQVQGAAGQPPNFELVTVPDGLSVPPDPDRWKARAGEIELRASDDGLFKVSRGKLTQIRSGSYRDPVISANGRWAAVGKAESEYEWNVVRIDLLTNKEYPVEVEGYGRKFPLTYIPNLNLFLIVTGVYGYEDYSSDGSTRNDFGTDSLMLMDPATGALQPIAGEFRPLAQQTFRPLQSTGKPGEFWAAIMDPQKNETLVGKFETRTFGFKQMLTIPKMRFNSMDMWADESAGKLYFVYRGHLLALPLPK